MQKIFGVVALITLLGFTSAASYTNGSWSIQPKEVANANNDSQLVNAKEIRLVSSGGNVLLQGVDGDNITQKSISTKDLTASDNKNYTLTGYTPGYAQTTYGDTRLAATVDKDNNGINQVYINRYKLVGPGASNTTERKVITSFKTNSVIQLESTTAFVHPGTKRFYVNAVLKDSDAAIAGTLVLVGVDVSGTATSIANLSDNCPTSSTDIGTHVSCAGIAGQKSLYCVWSHNATQIVGAKVDPNTNVTAADIRDVAPTSKGSQLVWAWSASNSYGVLVQAGDTFLLQSSNNNWASVNPILPANANAGILKVAPKNDFVVLFYGSSVNNKYNLQAQYFDRDGKLNSTVDLITDYKENKVFQHTDGSVYISNWNSGDTIYVGQVWGDTHLAASTLQAAVYACIALVAALFVF